MLYDQRWEKRFDPTPPGGSDRSWFLAVLVVPVFILGSTAADAFDDVLLLVVPMLTNVVFCLWSWARDRS